MTGATWAGFEIDPIAVSGAASDIRRRREASETRRVDVQSTVRAWIEDGGHRPWLEGQMGLTIDAEQVKALRAKIDLAYRGSDRRWATNYLVRALERGRLQCGWNVKVPPHVLTLRLPSPELNADTFVGLTKSTDIEQALLAYWGQCAQSAAPVTQEIIIISAIWNSALIDRKRMNAVDEQLRAGAVRVTACGRWAWAEWQDAPGNWQRHVFDPYTALLIVRWLGARLDGADHSIEATPEDREFPSPRLSLRVWRTLRSKLGVEAFGVRSWSDFIRAAQAKWHYALPPALAHYAHGKIDTASLPPHAWWRVLLGQRLAPQPDEHAEEGEDPPAGLAADGKGKRGRARGGSARAHPAGCGAEVRALMLGDNRRAGAVLVALRRYREQLSDSRKLDWLLCDWMIALMRPGGRTGNRLSSARELLTRVDRRLDAVLGSRAVDDPWIWNDSIEAIIQCAPQSSRGNIRTALAMLDAHVRSVQCWEHPEADLGRDEGSVVDAQLVTEREFQDVMQELRAQAVFRESEVAAILGYRCGLRRTEIRGLRLIDFQGRVEPLLFVRSHAGRALKRDSGRRVLQLKSLCTEEELELLDAQADASERMAQASPIARELVLLLPQASDLSAPLPEESLLGPVQDALREVCGEGAIRFHHLRHSAANRTLCDLMEAAVPGASHLLDPEGLSRDIASLRQRALVGAGQSLRPLVWATSALLGHVTPQTTLGSYVHVLDMLLGQATRREALALRIPSVTLAWLGKTSASSIDVLRHSLQSDAAGATPQALASVLIARHVRKLSPHFPLS
ncbi:MAG: DNA breaking-rejoining enzyme, catalytic core [Betaproteobacteria bacterium]|nr:DNA breaking-rejoining enzyme, catalytic core [Betaproteobacteria bacterium]